MVFLDKYYNKYYDCESKFNEKIIFEENIYKEIFFSYIKEHYDKETYDNYKNLYNDIFKCDSLWKIFLVFDKGEKDIHDFLKKNFLTKLNKQNIINSYMQLLTYLLVMKKYDDIEFCMDSFKNTKLIKNIEFRNNVFIITTLDNKKVRFTKLLDDLEHVESFKNMCHGICYDYIKNNVDKDSKSVTILEKNIFNCTRYHSFLIYNNMVNDFARNLLISFDDYKTLFDFKIVMFKLSNKLIEEISDLESNDVEFRNNDMFPILKYALHNQINKNRG